MSRRAKDRNRPIGVSGAELGLAFSAPLASDLSRSRSRCFMLGEFLVRQPLPGDRRTHLPKPLAIIVFSLVEPEGLFVQVPAQMCRIDTDVSTLEGPFQEAPEILDIIGV